MSHEPQGDPQGDGIYRREYRGFIIDESDRGSATLFDSDGKEIDTFEDYIGAERRADTLIAALVAEGKPFPGVAPR